MQKRLGQEVPMGSSLIMAAAWTRHCTRGYKEMFSDAQTGVLTASETCQLIREELVCVALLDPKLLI